MNESELMLGDGAVVSTEWGDVDVYIHDLRWGRDTITVQLSAVTVGVDELIERYGKEITDENGFVESGLVIPVKIGSKPWEITGQLGFGTREEVTIQFPHLAAIPEVDLSPSNPFNGGMKS